MTALSATRWAILAIVAILGILLGANGLIMLVLPETWFYQVPGVARTGLFNQHLVRDLGMLYVLIGAGLVTGVVRPKARLAVWGVAAIWLTGHAVFHFTEVATGICGAENLAIDFPGVTIPAILSIIATIWASKGSVTGSSTL